MARLELGSRMLLVAGWIGGCGGGAGSVADASSSSDTTASSSGEDESSTTVDVEDGSSSDASSGDDSSSDGGTTVEASTASARFIVRARKGRGELYDPVLLAYDEGVLAEPVPVALDLTGSRAVLGVSLGVVENRVHYCATDVPLANTRCSMRALDGDELGVAQPFDVGLLAAPTVLTTLPTPASTVGYVSSATAQPDLPSLYFTPMQNGSLQSPRVLAASSPELRIASQLSLSPDGAWLAYTAQDAEGVAHGFVTSTIAVQPSVVAVGEAPVDGETTAFVQWMPDSRAFVYRVDQDDVAGEDALYLQMIGADAAAPVRLDDPADPRAKGSIEIAPNARALTYVATDGTDGALVFVALGEDGPATPLVLHDEHTDVSWSADSRRLVYWARDVTGAPDYQVHDVADGTPEPLFTVREAMPGGAPHDVRFTADQRWLYVIASHDDRGDDLYRIDVSGDEPGLAQRVSTALTGGSSVKLDYALSANHSRLVYRADATEIGIDEVYVVDVAGEVPGEPLRIDVPTRAGSTARGAQISPNGTVATYHEVEHGEPWMLNMVDLEQPGEPVLLSRDAMGVTFFAD